MNVWGPGLNRHDRYTVGVGTHGSHLIKRVNIRLQQTGTEHVWKEMLPKLRASYKKS